MRLDANQLKAIREEVWRLDAAAEIYLFGSRADDAAKPILATDETRLLHGFQIKGN